MKRKTVIIAAIVAGVVLASGGGLAYSMANSVPVVGVVAVKTTTLDTSVSASEVVVAGKSVGIYPPTGGTLGGLRVNDGDKVAAGDVIAGLDRTPLRNAVVQAKAALETAQAQLAAINSGWWAR